MLEVNNLEVYHGDLQALWNITLNIKEGEIVALIGSNGAGKSTTLSTIAGLLKPHKGRVKYNGSYIEGYPAHVLANLGIALVPEGRKLFPEMSVYENLEMGAFKKDARNLKSKTLDQVYNIFPKLKERNKQLAGALSGGEQQMLAIGRALMSLPKLLLIDEMSLALAPVLVEKLAEVIRHINETRGTTILIVEQNVQVALRLSSRAYVIENGRIVGEGLATELLESESFKDAYLGISR